MSKGFWPVVTDDYSISMFELISNPLSLSFDSKIIWFLDITAQSIFTKFFVI